MCARQMPLALRRSAVLHACPLANLRLNRSCCRLPAGCCPLLPATPQPHCPPALNLLDWWQGRFWLLAGFANPDSELFTQELRSIQAANSGEQGAHTCSLWCVPCAAQPAKGLPRVAAREAGRGEGEAAAPLCGWRAL